MHVHMHIRYLYMYLCVYTVYIYEYVYMHMYVYIHIHKMNVYTPSIPYDIVTPSYSDPSKSQGLEWPLWVPPSMHSLTLEGHGLYAMTFMGPPSSDYRESA